MKLHELEKIINGKMKQLYPESISQSMYFSMEYNDREKTKYRIHAMALYRDFEREVDSEVIQARTIAECIAEMDRRMLKIKKVNHLDLD